MTKQIITKSLLAVFVTAALIAPLQGCGRKGSLEAPEGVDPDYPRTYPAPEKAPKKKK